jgi:ribosomal protein L31
MPSPRFRTVSRYLVASIPRHHGLTVHLDTVLLVRPNTWWTLRSLPPLMSPLNIPTAIPMALICKPLSYDLPLATTNSRPQGFVSARMVKMLLFKQKVLNQKMVTIMEQVKMITTTTTAMEKVLPKQELPVTKLRKMIMNTVISMQVSSKSHPFTHQPSTITNGLIQALHGRRWSR